MGGTDIRTLNPPTSKKSGDSDPREQTGRDRMELRGGLEGFLLDPPDELCALSQHLTLQTSASKSMNGDGELSCTRKRLGRGGEAVVELRCGQDSPVPHRRGHGPERAMCYQHQRGGRCQSQPEPFPLPPDSLCAH